MSIYLSNLSSLSIPLTHCLYRDLVLSLLEGNVGISDNLPNTGAQASAERKFRGKCLDELSKSSLAV
jgi:hypothetical protein